MNLLKLRTLFIMLAVFGLTFVACDDETTDPNDESPVITNVTPAAASAGDVITITGSGFGDDTQDGGTVYFNGTTMQATGDVGGTNSDYVSWTDTEIKVRIPDGTVDTDNVPNGLGTIQVYNGTTDLTSAEYDYFFGTAAAPTELKATSKNASTILLTWTAPTESSYTGYLLTITPAVNGVTEYNVAKTASLPYEISDLSEGTIYTFSLKAKYGNSMSAAAEVMWAPASRWGTTTAFKLYEYDSSNPSAIDFWDSSLEAPVTVKISEDKAVANVCFNNKDGNPLIQCGSAISIGTGTAPSTEVMGYAYDMLTDLDEAFDYEALSNGTFAETEYDLSNTAVVPEGSNIVFVFRVMEPGNSDYNYAKLLVKRGSDGEWLQGSGDDEYIEVELSYQTVAGVPYARKR